MKIQLGKYTTWHYNELGHGKGTYHGTGRTAKNLVFKKVKSGHCIIDSPLQFAQYAKKNLQIHYFIKHDKSIDFLITRTTGRG